MPIPVLVNGAFGKMGQIATKAINDHANFELVGQTGREYDLKQSIIDSHAKIVIDFTHPSAVFKNTETIIEANAHPVIGTSGLTAKEISILTEKCASLQLGALIVPNFSLGAVLMMRYAQEIVKYFPNVEIIEMHHDSKADSPSGTAIRSAELLANANSNIHQINKNTHETVKGARGALYRDIPIHAIRLPGLLAHQQILFGQQGETLSLCHDSLSRECFIPGICFACEKVMELDRLVYGLEKIL